MTAKGATALGAFVGAALAAGALEVVHASRARADPFEDVRKDITEMKADLKVIKCRLNIEGTCPR